MTVEHWDRVKELLHQAMQLAPEQRARFLDEACSSDNALRAEVESLLLADEGIRSSFLQSPPLAEELGADPDRLGAVGTLEAGQVFAQRFQLVRKLGEGGMGQVWLAEQTSPVRRQVALKLIKAGMYDEAVVQRFQSERQSLVCGIALHTMVVGQPYRLRVLREALRHIAQHPEQGKVWLARPGEIADHIKSLPPGTVPGS